MAGGISPAAVTARGTRCPLSDAVVVPAPAVVSADGPEQPSEKRQVRAAKDVVARREGQGMAEEGFRGSGRTVRQGEAGAYLTERSQSITSRTTVP